jgi:hypothetical protein
MSFGGGLCAPWMRPPTGSADGGVVEWGLVGVTVFGGGVAKGRRVSVLSVF